MAIQPTTPDPYPKHIPRFSQNLNKHLPCPKKRQTQKSIVLTDHGRRILNDFPSLEIQWTQHFASFAFDSQSGALSTVATTSSRVIFRGPPSVAEEEPKAWVGAEGEFGFEGADALRAGCGREMVDEGGDGVEEGLEEGRVGVEGGREEEGGEG